MRASALRRLRRLPELLGALADVKEELEEARERIRPLLSDLEEIPFQYFSELEFDLLEGGWPPFRGLVWVRAERNECPMGLEDYVVDILGYTEDHYLVILTRPIRSAMSAWDLVDKGRVYLDLDPAL